MPEKFFWNEEWRKIEFDGINEQERYELSNYGRIRRWKEELQEWKVLKAANIKGYVYYSFKSNVHWTKKISKCVHRLVAEEFCERLSPEHKYVIHLDYVKDNNYFKNLKWATKDEMFTHQVNNPNYEMARAKAKGRITNSKLTETQVIRLKKKIQRGRMPLYKIAREFGITHTQLNRIRSGENWGHVKV